MYEAFTQINRKMKITKILVPTDFSDCADNALRAAVSVAEQSQAEVFLLHIMSPSDESEKPDIIDIEGAVPNHISATEKLEAARQEVRKRVEQYSHIEMDGGISFDLISRQIFEFVTDKDVDLIVMGSHGASGIQEMTIGSNTQKVVRNAEVPVLVIKNESKEFKPQKIVFPSDFEHPTRHSAAASFLIQMTKWFSSSIHLLKVITPNNFEISSTSFALMEKFAEHHGLTDFTVNTYNSYNEEEGILNFAEESRADLVAMSTHGRKGLMHILMGSITENITNQSDIPIMTFKLEKD